MLKFYHYKKDHLQKVKFSSLILKKTLIFNLVFSILILFSFLSCKESTKPETVTFSGTVTLENESNHSGVKVSLYKPVVLDTAVVRINLQYPQIGVQISQETEFDHREHSPLHSTTTNASGTWKIENVTPGTYNVVAEKDSFGWEYEFEKNSGSIQNIQLFKESLLNGIIANDITLLANHHYIVTNDLTVPANLFIVIEEGVWIRFDGFYKIEINGSLNINGNLENFVHLTTNEDEFIIGKWRYIEGNNSTSIDASYFTLQYSKDGIRITNSSNSTIKYGIMRTNSFTGIHLNSVTNSFISNCIFIENEQSILAQHNSNNKIENSIFLNSVEGIKLEYSDNQIVENYFEGHENGIHAQFKPSSQIKHNEFYKNTKGTFCAGSDPLYQANNFNNNTTSIWIGTEYFSVNSKPVINFNNFENNDYAVKMTGAQTGQNIYDVDTSNNWWGTTVDLFIQDLIWDKHDEGPDSIYTGEVLYTPFSNTIIDTAGIINQ